MLLLDSHQLPIYAVILSKLGPSLVAIHLAADLGVSKFSGKL